jgi:LuxR family maltose regulon positive regulatory protein
VERAPLIDRIEASVAPLTVICAPAGFGKTTLMQQLRQRYQVRNIITVWLQLDCADNELGRFLQSLIGATHVALPQFFPPGLTNQRQGATAQGLAADLLDRISLSDAAIVLFLDDVELMTDQAVRDFLQRLMTNLGPHQRVIMGSRTAPGLALGRLRAHGLLLELDQGDLRFTGKRPPPIWSVRVGHRPCFNRRNSALKAGRGSPARCDHVERQGKSSSDWLHAALLRVDRQCRAEYLAQKSSTAAPRSNGVFCCARVCSANFVPKCAMRFSNELTAAT